MPSVPLPPKESNLFKRILVSHQPRSFSLSSAAASPSSSLSHTGLARCPPTRGAGLPRPLPELDPAEGKRMRRPRSPGGGDAGGGKAGAAAASSSFSSRFVPVSFLCLGPAEQAGRAPLAPGGGGAGMGWCRRRPGEGGKEGGREGASHPAAPPGDRGSPSSPPATVTPGGELRLSGAVQRAAAPSSPSLPPQSGRWRQPCRRRRARTRVLRGSAGGWKGPGGGRGLSSPSACPVLRVCLRGWCAALLGGPLPPCPGRVGEALEARRKRSRGLVWFS